ncbi:outer membrane protein assembly factor BamD [Wenzhouxiangella sp. XN79A]|uniref:outer membrane protein assembly factor BamD n=1 Tax=Wenzhouxiangella sp. XN79A TaxID=2724193 RepID=UPI00144A57F4|nr:outer membrane protein assembly factor BamD [Wenzhouxiangella sp. XN79A]NKI36263.1 outer membrane protein assembly factor BamD [Wenzhouxiangella sp. XN79A]
MRPSSIAAILVLLLPLFVLTGCGGDDAIRDDGPDAETLYEEARGALAAKSYDEAISLYRALTVRFPFGRHAEQALLDMAFAQHKARRPEQAISTLDRFLRTYPTHPNVDYAWYLKGLTNYEQTMGFLREMFPGTAADRDQQAAGQAFRDFQELIRRFPESRYVADARQRMVFLRNIMAEYEVTVARYYQRRGAQVAALNRSRYVIENYPGAPATVDALDIMARAYERMNMPDLAADTRRVLEYNYADRMTDDERKSLLDRLWPFD